ncbi:MAG TPA: SDR family oxidoreductase [Flavobacteriaceae bacterium]|nr:SDR family oxidoreductase [Flavobacteriaceae bacterium]
MEKEFNNNWAIILGGSSGFGLASAQKLAYHGMNIISIHRSRKNDLKEIDRIYDRMRKAGTQVLSFNIDALNTEKRKETLEKISEKIPKASVKLLLHSIAKGNLKSMLGNEPTLKHEDFVLTIEGMGISLYDWAKSVFEAQMFSENARILAFTSEGNRRVWKKYAAVSAAKVALEAITRNIAFEFAAYKITANCIQCGITETNSFKMIPGNEKLKKNALKRNPNKRLTQPEDIANVVYLLCREEANWINGTIVKADGGESLQ